MATKFASNPITVKHKGRTVGMIELELDPTSKEFLLEITDEQNHVHFKGIVEEDTFIRVDSSAVAITLLYLEPGTRKELARKRIDLAEAFGLQDIERGEKGSVAQEMALYDQISARVKDEMDNPKGSQTETEEHTLMLNKATMSQDARNYVETKIRQIVARQDGLPDSLIETFTQKIYAEFYGMGILQELDDDPDVGEIMVNAYTYPVFRCDVYYIKKGKKIKYHETFKSLSDLEHVFSRSIAFSKKELNNVENAIVEATRSNRDRVNIVIPDASESYVMNIRKFGNFVPNSASMREYGTVDDFIESLLHVVVRGKANIGIGGEMGTGKTTLINYMLTNTEPDERKVVIASVSETDVERVLKGHDVVIFNVDDEKNFSFSRLLRASMRTTASRVIIPESRGEEFRQVYEANGKTKGNMFTTHALDDYSFLDMCVDMYIGNANVANTDVILNKIAKSLDLVIIMRKVGSDIRIKSISEVVVKNNKFDHMNLLYYWDQDPEDSTKGQYRRTDNRLTDAMKARLNEYGIPMSQLRDL